MEALDPQGGAASRRRVRTSGRHLASRPGTARAPLDGEDDTAERGSGARSHRRRPKWRTWWASHQACGLPQPGNRHLSSRRTRARLSPAGTAGVRRPTSSGSEDPVVMMRKTLASHARRRAAFGVIGPVSSSSHRVPARPRSASRSTVTTTWGRSPATCGRSRRSNQDRQSSVSASARRCGALRSSSSPFRDQASCTVRSAVMTV
jgi:hypothetical protein